MAEITNTNPRGAGRMKKAQPISVAICLRLTEAEAKAVRASKHTKRDMILTGLEVLEKSKPLVSTVKKKSQNELKRSAG